jgi:hypothetical protein
MEIAGLLIALAVGCWVYTDARKRGKSATEAFFWCLGVALLMIVCLPIWLVTRPKLPEEQGAGAVAGVSSTPRLCAHCGKYYAGDPAFCPNCGGRVKGAV